MKGSSERSRIRSSGTPRDLFLFQEIKCVFYMTICMLKKIARKMLSNFNQTLIITTKLLFFDVQVQHT